MKTKEISIIVPTLNEAGNIIPLVSRIHKTALQNKLTYEIIFIDDHSTDKTVAMIASLAKYYPLQVFLKRNKPGKAQSLIEGLQRAKYDNLCFIDADLQYPPEAIAKMIAMLEKNNDLVVANRVELQTSTLRKIASKTFMYLFGRLLHGIDCDVQSGLKMFKRKVFNSIAIKPSPWTFDMELLVKAKQAGYRIGTVPIIFTNRQFGSTKINIVEASVEIGYHALKLKTTLLIQSLLQTFQNLRRANAFK